MEYLAHDWARGGMVKVTFDDTTLQLTRIDITSVTRSMKCLVGSDTSYLTTRLGRIETYNLTGRNLYATTVRHRRSDDSEKLVYVLPLQVGS